MYRQDYDAPPPPDEDEHDHHGRGITRHRKQSGGFDAVSLGGESHASHASTNTMHEGQLHENNLEVWRETARFDLTANGQAIMEVRAKQWRSGALAR